ncbi:MFS general substrate transporter-15 [Coleophoma cylindrospora]|uniref:MFS general substrate transporter-15 n=1 Tax=Coleophoma cylindrospora TaxID=1849047 RepID=A0A3D8RMI2_9HELO|nr:MFS general substrate transporter-15 [Coleophoma cylindrospora]
MTSARSGPTRPVGSLSSEKAIDISASESSPQIEPKVELPGPEIENEAPRELERWNESRTNIFRYLVTLYTFIAMGMSDASYGALIPYLETYYQVSYTVVSLPYLAPFVGYTISAILNNKLHMRWGQRGVAIIAPICKLIAFIVTCTHPPFPVIPVIWVFIGFGTGLEDGAWNAWVGNMANANELLGFLHGAYGLGATIGPLIATTMVTKGVYPWYYFYYLMVAVGSLEVLLTNTAFYGATGAVHRAAHPVTHGDDGVQENSRTRAALKNPITWICALFLLCYVGVEVSFGGWLVTFMLRVRHGGAFESGLVVTFFWLGLTIGRVVLGFVTGRIGEKIAIASYIVLSIILELCFWLIPSFLSSAVLAAFMGFFLGPLFPAAIVVATKLLPPRLHVSAIGFSAAFGGGGAALFPFAVGAIASAKGVQVLQPIALALLALILFFWVLLPGGFTKAGLERVRQDREDREAGRVPSERVVERTAVGRAIGKARTKLGIE